MTKDEVVALGVIANDARSLANAKCKAHYELSDRILADASPSPLVRGNGRFCRGGPGSGGLTADQIEAQRVADLAATRDPRWPECERLRDEWQAAANQYGKARAAHIAAFLNLDSLVYLAYKCEQWEDARLIGLYQDSDAAWAAYREYAAGDDGATGMVEARVIGAKPSDYGLDDWPNLEMPE